MMRLRGQHYYRNQQRKGLDFAEGSSRHSFDTRSNRGLESLRRLSERHARYSSKGALINKSTVDTAGL